MAMTYSLPDTPEIAELRKNDTRYRLRRWNAYIDAMECGAAVTFTEFAKEYDAKSDALTLDGPK